MRTTITIPDDLAEQIRMRAGDVTLAEFARQALAERVQRLEREALARAMKQGYVSEASAPSLEDGWDAVEVEGWE
jgi:hypothetical protein